MAAIFSQILNMTMTGSVVILLVLVVRLLLKRSPKIFSYALWSVVLFRLLCPVAFTAPISALDLVKPEMKTTSNNTSMITYLPAAVETQADFVMVHPEEHSLQNESLQEPEAQLLMTPMHAFALAWTAGAVGMILYSVAQYLRLSRKLIGSLWLKENVFLADTIDTAFVMGLFLPRIYLPSGVTDKERYYILEHEQHHIQRFDHIIKLLAYLALCIHWFNPLVWTAFILAGRDMEMSCDEAVIRKLGPQIRPDYSATLLRLATHRKIIAGMPLAFGEGDTKGRIMNMVKWKKPRSWVSVICIVLCAAVLAACAVNPEKAETTENTAAPEQQLPETTAADPAPVVMGADINTDAKLIQFGALNMLLPSGLDAVEENGILVLKKETEPVGGIALRHQEQPNSPDSFSQEWQAAIGVPEASDPSMGYMGGGSLYGDYEITYFPDIPLNYDDNGNIIPDENGTYALEQEVSHYFFLNGTDVYDLWFYINRLPDIMREALLKSCSIEGVTDLAAMESALNAEEEALEQCRRVLELIQSSDAYKIETKQNNGALALNETSTVTSWGCGNNRLHISVIPESGGSSSVRGLRIGDKMYECGTSREWREITWWDWHDPWLSGFQWDESIVAYQDTLTDESGTTVMLRIDQPFAEGEGEQPHYFVYFNFETDGAFRSVYLQTNLFMDNAASITESIVSLDLKTVDAEIQEEYRKAVAYLAASDDDQ